MKPKRSASRTVRTVYALVLISALGIGLGLYNAYVANRDAQLATGPQSEAQRTFFIETADRPDLDVFFKNLRHDQRVAMARNVGRYDDAQLAKLIGVCLADFDAQARAELTNSLAKVAKVHPDAVAEQLKLTGSFQQLGVQRALKSIGPPAVPMVVKQLTVGDARNNAVSFLVDIGEPAVPELLRALKDANADVRKAAADALGKIGAHQAVASLTAMYQKSKGDEQVAYLAALSAIGDARSQFLFKQNLDNESNPLPRRALAAIGLGHVGTLAAAQELWRYANHPDLDFRSQVFSALQLAGDAALQAPNADPKRVLLVAGRVNTPLAEGLVERQIQSAPTVVAIQAASDRPGLVPTLVAALHRLDPDTQGDLIDAAVQALGSTPRGIEQLKRLKADPAYAGFVIRRERLAG